MDMVWYEKFFLWAFWSEILKFAPTKISRYMVVNKDERSKSSISNFQFFTVTSILVGSENYML